MYEYRHYYRPRGKRHDWKAITRMIVRVLLISLFVVYLDRHNLLHFGKCGETLAGPIIEVLMIGGSEYVA